MWFLVVGWSEVMQISWEDANKYLASTSTPTPNAQLGTARLNMYYIYILKVEVAPTNVHILPVQTETFGLETWFD